MLRGGSVAELAAEMTDSHKCSILLLGADFARRAGVPGIEDVARWLLESEEEEDSGKLLEAFRERVQQMSTVERYTLFDAFYRSPTIPAAYWDLARVIRDGQFSLVLTCSVDLLLEEALRAVGLQLANDNQVFDPLISAETEMRPPSAGQLLVIRVHTVLAPDEAEKLLDQAKDIAEKLIDRAKPTPGKPPPILVLGYDFESDPANKLLSQLSGRLWWVASDPAIPKWLESFGSDREVRIIPTDAAATGNFLGELMAALLSVSPAGGPSRKRKVDSPFEAKRDQSPRTEASKDFEEQEAPPPHDKIAIAIRQPQIQKKLKAPPISPLPGEKVKEPPLDISVPEEGQDYRKGRPIPLAAESVEPKAALRQKLDEEKWIGFLSQSAEFSPEVTSVGDLKELKDVPRPTKDPRAKEIRKEESLRHQLRESREILARLEQQEWTQPPWDAEQLRSEIAYQREQVARLEQEWSRLPSTKRRVEDALRAILDAAKRAQTKPEVLEYLKSQAAIVSKEQEREEPNGDLIAVAISGVVLLAGRLGGEVADPTLVRELASLIPGATGGRV